MTFPKCDEARRGIARLKRLDAPALEFLAIRLVNLALLTSDPKMCANVFVS